MSHKFEFIGGNVPKCTLAKEDHQDCLRYVDPDAGFQYIPLVGNIASLQAVTEENKKSFIGKAGWGLVGGLALGGVGAIAGLIAGGNKKETIIALTMKSGENIMATVNQDTFKWLLGIYSTPAKVVPIKTIAMKITERKAKNKNAFEDIKEEKANWNSMSPEERKKLRKKNKISLICIAVIIICIVILYSMAK